VDIDHRAEHLLAPDRTEHDRLAIVETQPVTADDLVDELDEPAARLQQRCPATEGQVVHVTGVLGTERLGQTG
jgi:hypothetical protein